MTRHQYALTLFFGRERVCERCDRGLNSSKAIFTLKSQTTSVTGSPLVVVLFNLAPRFVESGYSLFLI